MTDKAYTAPGRSGKRAFSTRPNGAGTPVDPTPHLRRAAFVRACLAMPPAERFAVVVGVLAGADLDRLDGWAAQVAAGGDKAALHEAWRAQRAVEQWVEALCEQFNDWGVS